MPGEGGQNEIAARHARRLLGFLSKRRDSIFPLLILTHNYPDPDALAAAFALDCLAEGYGIQTTIAYGGVIGRAENRAMVRILKIPVRKVKSATGDNRSSRGAKGAVHK